jgi:Reverse transcriptase (RNA-dependent DNA polymerase)
MNCLLKIYTFCAPGIILFIHLKLLFYVMFAHGFVPDKFGDGVINPLMKDKTGDINSIDNYRPITLTPIVAKVFETLSMDICENELVTNELHFGFKKGVGCNDAIFTLKTIINRFISSRNSVFSAVLDVRKAFDRVPHGKLMKHLRKLRLPLTLSMFYLMGMINCKQLCVGIWGSVKAAVGSIWVSARQCIITCFI